MKRVVVCGLLAGCLSTPAEPNGRGRRWRELPAANQPGALHSVDMVFDETRQNVVLYGGAGVDGAVTATWELTNDEIWEPICALQSPPPLYDPALGYDPVSMRLVLVGGSMTADLQNPTNVVWVCDSANPLGWSAIGTLPVSIASAHLVYDKAREEMAVVGGVGERNNVGATVLTSTDLMTWTPREAVQAPAQFGGSAPTVVYDPGGDRILALKNYTSEYGRIVEATDELWALGKNASNWALLCADCTGGEPRSEAALVDTGNGSTYLLNGYNSGRSKEYAGAWILDDGELVQTHDDPPARDRGGAVFNNDSKNVIVYGGAGSGCAGPGRLCDTTWVMFQE